MITETKWIAVGDMALFPPHLGSCVKVNGKQIAVFQLPTEKRWYAVQNYNPQNQRMVLSRGLTGDENGTPIVICPLHKYRYSLEDGSCLTDESYSLEVFAVKEEDGEIYVAA